MLRTVVCTRYATNGNYDFADSSSQESTTSASDHDSASASLYFTSGSRWSFELDECTSPSMMGGSSFGDAAVDHSNSATKESADFRMVQSGMRQNCVIIASEPLNVYTE